MDRWDAYINDSKYAYMGFDFDRVRVECPIISRLWYRARTRARRRRRRGNSRRSPRDDGRRARAMSITTLTNTVRIERRANGARARREDARTRDVASYPRASRRRDDDGARRGRGASVGARDARAVGGIFMDAATRARRRRRRIGDARDGLRGWVTDGEGTTTRRRCPRSR